MSAIDLSSNAFDEDLEKLASILLCSKNKHNRDQSTAMVAKWQRKIRDAIRRGGNTIMGEPGDTDTLLLDEISDLLERRLRY